MRCCLSSSIRHCLPVRLRMGKCCWFSRAGLPPMLSAPVITFRPGHRSGSAAGPAAPLGQALSLGQDTVLDTRSQSVGRGMQKGGEGQRGLPSERTVQFKRGELYGGSWGMIPTRLLAGIPRSQCFELALRSLCLVFCFSLLSRVSLGKLKHVRYPSASSPRLWTPGCPLPL